MSGFDRAALVPRLGSTSEPLPHSLGPVADDWEAIEVWLKTVAMNSPNGSPQTIATYRYHLAKLRWYCDNVCKLPPSHWSMQEVTSFKSFLENVPDFAIATRDVIDADMAVGAVHAPFRKRPSASSQGDIIRFVSAMFTALHQTGYIGRDPTALLKSRKAKRLDKTRTVDLDMFAEALAGMKAPAGQQPNTASRLYRRDRFVLIALRELGLRASELVGAGMAAVSRLTDPISRKSYWVITVSDESAKGGTGRTVPFTQAAMDALVAYRIEFGLVPLPTSSDPHHLLLSPRTKTLSRAGHTITSTSDLRFLGNWGSVRTRHGLYRIVKNRLGAAAQTLELRGEVDAAARLRQVSPHWLRHTFATAALLRGHAIRHVATSLGHSNLKTTMDYTEQEALDQIRAWEATAPGVVASG